jgi:hypothetical protein
MAEIRKVQLEEIEDMCSYTPNIPSNWYVPAQHAWKYLAWCLLQIRNHKTFRNDKDMNRCMGRFEDWIEDTAFSYGEVEK